jgi:hypothetical protein
MATRCAVALCLLLCLPNAAGAQDPRRELPQAGSAQHLGVRTCAGAPCHGNQAAVGRVVQQNEYGTWSSQRDAHSRGFDVLLEEPSRRIGRKLGLRDPSHESAMCLDCHADHVPLERRGKQFSLEDGVGCEACHGGAETWLGPHISGSGDHQRYVELGLYPTDDPVARAELCLSCHYGTERKFVRHRLYGAGHPRLSFELDTFSATQPAHFRIDEDYVERGKQASNAARTWAIGQAVIVRSTLAALLDGRRKDGIWPELSHFDCYACHHPMSELRWSPRPAMGVYARPGVARLNDASLLMLRLALEVVDRPASERLEQETFALHGAYSAGTHDAAGAVNGMRASIDGVIPELVAWKPTEAQIRAIALRLIDEGTKRAYLDYPVGEQAAMAAQALAQGLHELGALGDASRRAVNVEVEQLGAATRDPERYEPDRVAAILTRMRPRFE